MTRSLHARLQGYCDCYVESDLKAGLEKLMAGTREPIDEDATEAALKVLAFMLLGAVERRSNRICVSPKHISLSGGNGGLMATFSPNLTRRVNEIVGVMSGADEGKAKGRISLGLRGSEIELCVEHGYSDDKEDLVIGLPGL